MGQCLFLLWLSPFWKLRRNTYGQNCTTICRLKSRSSTFQSNILTRTTTTCREKKTLTEGVAVTCSFKLCSWTWWTRSSSRAMWSFVSSISCWYCAIFSRCFSTVLCSSPCSFSSISFFLSSFSILPIFWLCREMVARRLVFSCCMDVWLSSLAVPSAWRSLQK